MTKVTKLTRNVAYLMLLHLHWLAIKPFFKDYIMKAMDEINFERVASEFINLNDGRKRYFGSYSNFVDSS